MKEFTYWLVFAITVVTAISGIIMVIYRVTGHSPTIQEVILALVATIAGLLIHYMNSTSKFEGKTSSDISYIKKELHELKIDVKEIRKELSN